MKLKPDDMSQHIGKIGLAWDSHRVLVGILMYIKNDSCPYRVNSVDSNGKAIHNPIGYENFRPGGIDLPGWNLDGTRKEESSND